MTSFDSSCRASGSTIASYDSDHVKLNTSRPTSLSNNSQEGSRRISVLAVPIMDPFYRDLQALKADHAALQNKLKVAQQTLHGSCQDLSSARERSKRAETDSGRLRTQMDAIFKKHVEHHPEREFLAQQLAETQARLELELGSRQALEHEHQILQREFLRVQSVTTAASLTTAPPKTTAASPLPSPASVRSLMFGSFLKGGGSQRKTKNSGSSGVDSVRERTSPAEKTAIVPDAEEILVSETGQEESDHRRGRNLEVKSKAQDSDSSERHTTPETSMSTLEQFDSQRLFYNRLGDENVAMKTELQDLRHRYRAEKDSIKGYMSLFESLQKKHSNALAVSQSEIDLLRSQIQDQQLCLMSRESLIQALSATFNSQAVDLETLTNENFRERSARAKVEQEMALLLEASLSMLERWFENVQKARLQLRQCLDPVEQTIQHLEVPSIVEEWAQCEKKVEAVMEGLAQSVIWQHEAQEMELDRDVFVEKSSSSGQHHWDRQKNGSISSTQSHMSNITLSGGSETNYVPTLALDCSHSQQVFAWRRTVADSYLEENVQGVEKLAREKRELQLRLVDLTQLLADQGNTKKADPTDASVFEKAIAAENDHQEDHQADQEDPLEKATSVSEVLLEEVVLTENQQVNQMVQGASSSEGDVGSSDQNCSLDVSNHDELACMVAGIDVGRDMDMKADKGEHTKRLENLLKEVLDWGDASHALLHPIHPTDSLILSPKTKRSVAAAMGGVEEDILGLGISDTLPQDLEEQECLGATTRSDPDTTGPTIQGLKTIILRIRHELSRSSHSEAGEVLPAGKVITEPTQPALTANPSTSKYRHRPQAIKTDRSSWSSLAYSPNMTSSPSSLAPPLSSCSSSFSSSSGYFFSSSLSIAGLATPIASPGLGGFGSGPDGKTSVLDVDALCRDLAFRSFPKQHHWSKSRTFAAKDPKETCLRGLTWHPAQSCSLPPLPPQPHV